MYIFNNFLTLFFNPVKHAFQKLLQKVDLFILEEKALRGQYIKELYPRVLLSVCYMQSHIHMCVHCAYPMFLFSYILHLLIIFRRSKQISCMTVVACIIHNFFSLINQNTNHFNLNIRKTLIIFSHITSFINNR